jgi:hypothetical protein
MSNPMRQLEPLVSLARRSAEAVERAESAAGLGGTPPEFARLQLTIRRRNVRRRWAVGAATVGVATAAAVALVGLPRSASPLTYAVAGDVQLSGEMLEARGTRPVQVDFSEGTKVLLAPGGRAEIVAIDAQGARLRVHDGRAHFAVTHKPGARWSVVAGPFTVQVVGTEFDVTWSSAAETLEVALLTGSLYVEGPPPLSLPLQAGRRLVVRGPTRALEIGVIEATAPVVPAPAPAPAPSHAGSQAIPSAQPKAPVPESKRGNRGNNLGNLGRVAALAPAASPPAKTLSPPPAESPPAESLPAPSQQPRPLVAPVSWSVRMAAGEYKIVVDEALSAGLEQSLRARPTGDLSALSDAARYVGRADLARRALLAQRQRFPETDNAASAAFHLGTLAEKRDPTSREACRWYDLYLSAAPAGTFVPETLGRKMLILERRDDVTGARSIAEAYRRQFPAGPYRRQADRILARP